MTRLATVISRIFEPMIVFSLLVVAGTYRAGLRWGDAALFLLFVLVVMIVPIVAMRFWFVRAQGVDWDIRDRKKRILPLFALLALVALDVLFVSLWQSTALTSMFALFFIWMVGFVVITLFWKISAHTGAVTLFYLMILRWYGLEFWPLLVSIPIVAWARVAGKNHTIGQAVGGIVYSTLLHEIWKSFLR